MSIRSLLDAVEAAAPEFLRKFARRVRIHYIYFLLALFDLLAVGMGLHLSHRLNNLLTATIQSNVEWSRIQTDIGNARRAAAAANAPANDLFATKDIGKELATFDSASIELEEKLEIMKRNSAAWVPLSHKEQEREHHEAIDLAYEMLTVTATSVFDIYRRGLIEAATISAALMDRQNGELISKIDAYALFLHALEITRQSTHAAKANRMQKLEYLLGSMILFMVLGVTIFGHFIGRKFQRQYDEIASASAKQEHLVKELQASNADVMRLNGELATLNRDLEARVKERTWEIETANESITDLNIELANSIFQLKEAQDEIVRRGKLAQLGRLTATVAHEIRNPLGSVKTAAYLVERKLKDQSTGLEKQFERINNGIKRCDTIITELLDFARSKTLMALPVGLDDWLSGCIDEESKVLPPGVTIICDLGAGEAVVDLDPDRMRRVMINLLANAAEAMVGKGDVRHVRAGEDPAIRISSRVEDGTARITVTDNGPGIPEDTLKKITEPLFTTKSFGVGLGLPAVEQILQLHGGGLDITSKPGEGATFIAYFPARMAAREAA